VNYQKQYNLLIAKHGKKHKPVDSEYYERHHILPKSLGGNDTNENLCYLSGKAHYVAHYLLYRIHGVGVMASAFRQMFVMDPGSGKRYIPNARSYDVARKAHAKSASIALTGAKSSSAKPANIYSRYSKEPIATNVVISTWVNGTVYDKYMLRKTACSDRTKRSTTKNPHYHKGIYARYLEQS